MSHPRFQVFLTVLLSAFVLSETTGCMTANNIVAQTDSVRRRLVELQGQNIQGCAPQASAAAEADLEFVRLELKEGDAVRAEQHLVNAKRAVEKLESELSECRPDRDRDGVIDEQDRCPELPGKKELAGCTDWDKDGVWDPKDKCPQEPEDRDSVQDDDGCPETDADQDGIADARDACPEKAGVVESQGCPERDVDQDRVIDRLDACPQHPEDIDGFQDADGCPDPDNDGDGILDAADKCPNQAETRNNHEDEDGCPDHKLIKVRRDLGRIELKQRVYFKTGKARIRRRSYMLLNEIVSVLKAAPDMKLRIEGHTDSRGSARRNKRLSRKRAQAVRRYLSKKGIPKRRLRALGYGESRPIASNRTRSGRRKNRRVEFNIEGPPAAPEGAASSSEKTE